MSDEPSDAQKLIAEVMVTHALVYDDWAVVDADFYTCACGWHLSTSASVHDHAAHVAAEVDKALGGLTRQWAASHEKYPELTAEQTVSNSPVAADDWLSVDEPGWVKVSRFVSGWTVTE